MTDRSPQPPLRSIRLNKVIAQATGIARRKADGLIEAGRIAVNGRVVRTLGAKADPARDEIRFDGELLTAPPEPVLYRFYKPSGVVSTLSDELDRPSLAQYLPAKAGLFPIGRLDRQSEGLLLLTNDGALALRLAHPRYRQPKVYRVWLHKPAGYSVPALLAALKRRYMVAGRHRAFDAVEYRGAEDEALVMDVTVHEGVFHEVKRLVDRAGYTVARLLRLSHGPVVLDDMKPGELRQLTAEELGSVRAQIEHAA